MTQEVQLSNRVFQLESRHLNGEFMNILDQQVDKLSLPAASEEIKLLFKLYLQWNLIKEQTTIGMKLYHMKYYANSDSNLGQPSRIKLAILSACTLIFPYLVARQDKVQSVLNNSILSQLRLPWLTFDNIVATAKSLDILNFFLFLRGGQLSLTEKILGLVQGMQEEDYQRGLSINKVQMELMNRELIWKTLAEFLTFVVPLINVEYIKNTGLRLTGLACMHEPTSTLAENVMKQKRIFKCAICDKQPFNPFSIGCRHLFCYYCLHSKHLSDPTDGYACPVCAYRTKDRLQVQRYTSLNHQ